MMETLYDVCFAGQLLEGQELQVVRQNLGKLFNADPGTLDKLFSGKTQLVKRGCDKATAVKYKQAMEKAGARPVIRANSISQPESTGPATGEAGATAAGPEAEFDLAPEGSDVLRPEERSAPVSNEVDTAFLELAAVGTTMGESQEAAGQAPETSHLSMGEVGEDIPNLEDTRKPVNPDINNIALSPEGTDFSDCTAEPAEAPDLDLSGIVLAPEGSDVLEPQYRKKDEGPGPSTEHIRLED